MSRRFQVLQYSFLACAFLSSASSQILVPKSDPGTAKVIRQIVVKYSAVKRYAIEGQLDVARQSGENPKDVLAKAKIKLAVAPGGKFLIRVDDQVDKTKSYMVVSDGHKTWTTGSEPTEYTEHDMPPVKASTPVASKAAAPVGAKGAAPVAAKGAEAETMSLGDTIEAKKDTPERFSKQIVPVLANLDKRVELSFIRGQVLSVISKKDADGFQSLVYVTFGTEKDSIGRLTWMQSTTFQGKKYLIRSDFAFSDFRTGEKVTDAEFSFKPPTGAKLVESLEVPGRS